MRRYTFTCRESPEEENVFMVSRKPRGGEYTFTGHENPEGENVLPSEGTNNRDPPHTVQRYNEQ